MWDQFGTLYEPASWLTDGGPIASQAAMIVNIQTDTRDTSATTDSSQTTTTGSTSTTDIGGSAKTSSTHNGISAAEGIETVSGGVNHGFSTSAAVKPSPDASAPKGIHGNGSANATSGSGARIDTRSGDIGWLLVGQVMLIGLSMIGGVSLIM
jgi:hypothetical protein